MRRLYSLPLSHLLLALLCVPGAGHAASIPNNALDPVAADLAAGRADDAISRLNLSLTAQPADAEAHNLLCRVYYQEQRWDDAIHQCEAAVQLEPLDSGYHLWLGRAYGEKADSIHSIKAYGLAKKVKSEFERAVQLDSKNITSKLKPRLTTRNAEYTFLPISQPVRPQTPCIPPQPGPAPNPGSPPTPIQSTCHNPST